MKSKTIIGLMASVLVFGLFPTLGETNLVRSVVTSGPEVSLKEALSLAEQYVAERKIDVSQHFMDSIRLVSVATDIPNVERRWIVSWLKISSLGGEIYLEIKMDKSVSMYRGI